MGCRKSSSNREVHSNKCQHPQIRKNSNKQPNFMPQGTRKTKSKVNRRKEKTKIRAERYEIAIKNPIDKIDETKLVFKKTKQNWQAFS